MPLGTVVLNEQDRQARGPRFTQQARNIRQHSVSHFARHQLHQAGLDIDNK
jgi:hypothetical protein